MTTVAELEILLNAKDKATAVLKTLESRLQGIDKAASAAGSSIAHSIGGGSAKAAQQVNTLADALKRAADEAARLGKIPAPNVPAGGTGGGPGRAPSTPNPANTQRAADEALRLAQAQARGAAIAQDYAQAQSILQSALNQYAVASNNSANAALRLQTAQNQLAGVQAKINGSSRTITNSFNQVTSSIDALKGGVGLLTNGLGALGITFGAQAVVQFGIDAVKSANALEKTEATVRALSGTQAKYNELVMLARQGQTTYGGSLQSNIASLGALVNTSNRYGVSLQTLDNLSRRLATVDPAQGVEGASLALKEFLSGDITSLAERFEISRSALRNLNKESVSTTDKVKGLDTALNDLGISNATLSAASQTTANSFDVTAAKVDNLKTKIGELLAQATAAPVRGLGVVADSVSQNIGVPEQAQEAANQAFAGAASFEDYGQRIAFVNTQLSGLRSQYAILNPAMATQIPTLTGLSEAQFNYAQSLIKTGTDAQTAFTQAEQLRGTFEQIGVVQASVAENGALTAQQLDAVSNALIKIANDGVVSAVSVDNLNYLFQTGQITSVYYANAILALSQAKERQAQASALSADANYTDATSAQEARNETTSLEQQTQAYINTLREKAVQTQIGQAENQALAATERALAQQAQIAAQAILAGGGNITATAARLASSSSLVDQLTAAYLRLARAQAAAGVEAQKAAKVRIAASGSSGADEFVSDIQSNKRRQVVEDRRALAASAQEAAKAQRDLDQAQGNYQSTIDQYNRDLAAINNRLADLVPGSEEYNKVLAAQARTQRDLNNAQESATRGGKKGGGGGDASGAGDVKLTDQQRLNNQLSLGQMKADQKAEDAAEQHEKKMLQILKDYGQKRVKAEQGFQNQLVDSRASFYDAVGGLKDNKLQQQFAAQYEAAVQESQRIAAEKGPDVAETFLAAQEKVLADQARRQQEIVDAEESGDKGRAEFLRGLDELKRQAEQRRTDQAKAGEDSLAQQQQEAIDAESARYEEQQGKVATSAERSAQRQVIAAELAGKKIDENATKVANLADQYDRVAPSTTTQSPTSPLGASPSDGSLESGGSGGPSILDRLAAIVDAVRAATEAITAEQSRTTRATEGVGRDVRGLAGASQRAA